MLLNPSNYTFFPTGIQNTYNTCCIHFLLCPLVGSKEATTVSYCKCPNLKEEEETGY